MNNSKKILVIQPFLSYGGAESVSIGIANYFRNKKYDSKLVALFVKKTDIRNIDKINLVLAPNPWSELLKKYKLLFYLFGFPILFYLVLKESKNTTLLNPHNFPTLWIAVIIGKIRKIPVIWTVHNFPQSKLDFLNGFFAKHCNKIIAVSPKVKKQIYNKYKLNSEISYPAIDFNFFSKGKKRHSYNKTTALLVTRLSWDKNINFAIDAVKNKKLDLLIIGEGTETLKKQKNVKFLGYRNAYQLRDLYKSVDFLILPSYKTEGFNLVPFEGACAGKPSVVVQGCGADEIIFENNLGMVAKPEFKSFSGTIDLMIKNYKKFKTSNWVKQNLSDKNYKIYDI